MPYRYGKKAARPGAMLLTLRDYVDKSKLPPVPENFGHDSSIVQWNLYGNATYGDCVWAGAAHETMIWNAVAGHPVTISTADVLDDYAAVTGFDPKKPDTDQGTDMVEAAQYRQKVGIRDTQNNRHKIGAYLSLQPGDLSDIWAATYLFGAVGIGLKMPESTQTQFDAGQPWTVVSGSKIDGGHYTALCGRQGDYLHVITWGAVQRMTLEFFQTFCDEAVAYLSAEDLTNGKSPEGFDYASLTADLAALA